ncbi:MAG: ABC transporter substrate-binding protein [Chloroflexota bacterium]
MKRFNRVLALMLALVLVLSFASFTGAQDERVLVIGHAESTDFLDPQRGFTQTTSIIRRATYDTLTTFPAQDASEVLPRLATSWEVSEDGTAYTFTLREDVTFVSGNPLTAEDVVFTIERLQNVQGNPAFLADNIESVVANEDGTVTFNLVAGRPSFLAELANTAFSIVDAETVIANGGSSAEDAAETDTADQYLNNTSAGTGPYILESWTPQDETVMVKNPNFWGEEAYFDRLIIVNIPEAATQQIALEAGDIDMALDMTRDQTDALAGNPDIVVESGQSVYTHFILMNQDSEIGGIVSDPTVQLAVRYALDYDGYKALWGGATPPTNLFIGLAGSYGEDQAFTRDLDRSRELLAEAGYPDGFDITLNYPDFTWQGVNMNTNAQKIQADLAEVGINVTLQPGELQVSLEEYRNGDQGFAYWFWGPDVLDPLDVLSFLPGGKVATERTNWDPAMVGDEELLALIEQAATETDTETRLEVFAALQDKLQESGPFAPFNVPALQTAHLADIEGYFYHPQWTLDIAILTRAE